MSGRVLLLVVGLVLGLGLLLVGGAVLVFRPEAHSRPRRAATPLRPHVTRRHPPPRKVAPSALEQRRAIGRLVKLGYPVYCGGGRKRDVALTFDDGPGPYTPIALRMLRRAHARATFFLVGKVLKWFPGMPRKEAKLAALGDHTWTHSHVPSLSAQAIRRELARTKRAVTQLSRSPVLLYRPPYGVSSRAASSAARRLGLVEVLWSTDSADSAGADPRQILANVTAGLHPGAIILMHENRGQTLKALKAILRRAKRRHLRPVTVPELLAADPPSLAQLRKGVAACARP